MKATKTNKTIRNFFYPIEVSKTFSRPYVSTYWEKLIITIIMIMLFFNMISYSIIVVKFVYHVKTKKKNISFFKKEKIIVNICNSTYQLEYELEISIA